jgi:hypothetical protein
VDADRLVVHLHRSLGGGCLGGPLTRGEAGSEPFLVVVRLTEQLSNPAPNSPRCSRPRGCRPGPRSTPRRRQSATSHESAYRDGRGRTATQTVVTDRGRAAASRQASEPGHLSGSGAVGPHQLCLMDCLVHDVSERGGGVDRDTVRLRPRLVGVVKWPLISVDAAPFRRVCRGSGNSCRQIRRF